MEFVMNIADIATIPEVGNVIIGKNPSIEKEDLSGLCRRGQDIVVKGKKEKLQFIVKDVRLTFSISEKIIISIEFEESENFHKLRIGDSVYKI